VTRIVDSQLSAAYSSHHLNISYSFSRP